MSQFSSFPSLPPPPPSELPPPSSSGRLGASSSKAHHHHHHHLKGLKAGGQGQGQGGVQRSHRVKHSVHWFRKGLRLSDNPALLRAIKRADTWRCIFILDPWFAGASNQGINKWRFLLQCLEDLDQSLRKLNSRLFVVRGQPADVLPQLFREWSTNYFTFEEDPEPFGQVRDRNIVAMCKELNVNVVREASHTLYDLEKLIELNNGKPPLTYRQFIRLVSSIKAPSAPVPALSSRMLHSANTPVAEDHDDRFGVPTLHELGFETRDLRLWPGGETEALRRLERHLERKAFVASFGRPKMTPESLLASQTGLSPYLRFGCLSTRLFYHALGDLYRKIKKDDPPLSLFGQLLWRDFFYTAATKNPNFDRMYGNPICVQIPWDKNAEALAKWANGRTGFPWIDAIMTQLREEGWIHHLARHAVACFLTRGDLWISWEEGMKVFEELLLDADWSVNAGTWMWLSCSSFFQQFFHLYCPVKFGRKADPGGDYIRRYLPVLKNFPTRYIHEPWTAPEQVQRAAKCLVGKDYPVPMVDHAHVAKINQERMRQVYQQLSTFRGGGTAVQEQVNDNNGNVASSKEAAQNEEKERENPTSSDALLQQPSTSGLSLAQQRHLQQRQPHIQTIQQQLTAASKAQFQQDQENQITQHLFDQDNNLQLTGGGEAVSQSTAFLDNVTAEDVDSIVSTLEEADRTEQLQKQQQQQQRMQSNSLNNQCSEEQGEC